MLRWRQFRSEQVRSHHRKVFVWKLGLSMLAVMLLVWCLAELSSLPKFAWQSVSVEGNKHVHSRDVYELITPRLSGRILGVIDRRNRFVFSHSDAEALLLEAFPRIESVESARDGDQLTISIVERVAAAVSCSVDRFDDCLLVDATGYQFAPAELRGSLFVYHTEPLVRSYVRPTDEFEYLSTMRHRLEKLGLHSVSLALLPDEMTLLLQGGTKVRFGLEDHERQFENLATILESEEYATETDGDITKVAYFDLRFGDRVFYKLRADE